MIGIQAKEGVYTIDTNPMTDEEKDGVIRLCIDVKTGRITIAIAERMDGEDETD